MKLAQHSLWATVYETVRPMLTDRCPVLSVTLVYCSQTAGWIKMKLQTWHGGRLGPGDIVLDGDPAPLPKGGHSSPQISAHVLWPNGWMDQYAT